MPGEPLTILVAEDDPDCRELYSIWLDDYDVRMRTNGEAALAAVDEEVDLVFLDRDMPRRMGMEVAAKIAKRPADPYVAMVSSKEPEFDVAEAPLDCYLEKPVRKADLVDVVDTCRTHEVYQEALEEYFALTATVAAIEAERDEEELSDDERYRRLRERLATKRAEVDEALSPGRTDWQLAFRTCTGAP